MQCPKCESALVKVMVKTRPEYGADILSDAGETREIEVDQCLSCDGIWFDVKELEKYLKEKLIILESPGTDKSKAQDNVEGNCPRCSRKLVKRPAPLGAHFRVDVCESCEGVWLDGTEIDRLEVKNFSWGERHALLFRNMKALFFGN